MRNKERQRPTQLVKFVSFLWNADDTDVYDELRDSVCNSEERRICMCDGRTPRILFLHKGMERR